MHGFGPYITLIVVHSVIAGVNFGLAMAFSKIPLYSGAVLLPVFLGLVFLFMGVPYHVIKFKRRLDEVLAKGDSK